MNNLTNKNYIIAPIGKRFTAQFIDEVFIVGIAYAVLLSSVMFNPEYSEFGYLIFIFMIVIYSLISDGIFSTGQSIGKKIMGLYVVRSDNEEPCGMGRSICRNITYVLGFIDFIFLVFRRDKRRLGDLIANTKVVVKMQI